MIHGEAFAKSVGARLSGHGFSLVDHRYDARAMGNAMWIIGDGSLDVYVVSERSSQILVTVGKSGKTGFEVAAWSVLLHVEPPVENSPEASVDFILQNLSKMRDAAKHLDLDEKLAEVNWGNVKVRLGLPPDTPPPGQAAR